MNVPTMIPYLTVRNARNALAFYQRAFGFVWINAQEADTEGCIDHVEMRYRDILIMFASEGAFGSIVKSPVSANIVMPLTLYLYCDHVDGLYKHILQEDACTITEPWDAFWGDRVLKVIDPDGFEWMFATSLKRTEK